MDCYGQLHQMVEMLFWGLAVVQNIFQLTCRPRKSNIVEGRRYTGTLGFTNLFGPSCYNGSCFVMSRVFACTLQYVLWYSAIMVVINERCNVRHTENHCC